VGGGVWGEKRGIKKKEGDPWEKKRRENEWRYL